MRVSDREIQERDRLKQEIIEIDDDIIKTQKEIIQNLREQIELYKQLVKEAYSKGYDDGMKAYSKHVDLCKEEAECDRNICKQNEYNGIGCDGCVVNNKRDEETE